MGPSLRERKAKPGSAEGQTLPEAKGKVGTHQTSPVEEFSGLLGQALTARGGRSRSVPDGRTERRVREMAYRVRPKAEGLKPGQGCQSRWLRADQLRLRQTARGS